MPTANVLLVDDEIPFVETVTRRLSKRGLHIVTALSGEEALQRLEKDRSIEIVILDVKMPGMGGLEILAEVKKGISSGGGDHSHWPPYGRVSH